MTEQTFLHGSALMEDAIRRNPELRIIGGGSDHVAKLAAAMEALKPADAVSITFTDGLGMWTCQIWRPDCNAYGTGLHAIVAYGVAMAEWAGKNPEASAGRPTTTEGN